jgi:NAD(P)-dependent dehydrogenase (short-subunit alcohol dehydrogenase family)
VTRAVAVVTGASRGIGHHIATALEQSGYAVERGSRAVAEVTDRLAVERWVRDIVARQGRIDLLVNNAGVIDAEVPLPDSDPDEWWRTMEVNVLGPYLLTRAVLPHMVAAGGGRVVNLNSGAANRPGHVASAYNASKTALARLTGSTHLAGRAHGIRAFDLAPGVVRTDMTESMRAHIGRTQWTSVDEVTDLVLALAGGELDDWSGRMVRAGADTPATLAERASEGLRDADRTITLQLWGAEDPLA